MSYSYDKILGMMWGLHAGDSLGAPIEFLPPSAQWNTHTEMTGGGSFKWKIGEATDDTDLMLCVLRAIESPQKFSFDILKTEMLQWLDSNPPDIGTTTLKGLKNLKADMPLRDCGFVDDKFQGNGSLMRVAPLALLTPDAVGTYRGENTVGLQEILQTQAKMTHGHPYCYQSDIVLIATLQNILQGGNREEAYQAALKSAAQTSPYIYERLLEVPQIPWDALKSSGFCVDTLCAAMWGFLRYDDFEDALIAVVNRGDDADSCGAVAGALCGAYYGTEAIPPRWLETLEFREEIQKTLAKKDLNLLG